MHKKLQYLFTGICILSSFFLARQAWAASLLPSPQSASLAVGETASIVFQLDSQGQSINTVGLHVIYDPAFLDVVQVSRGHSFLTLWAEEPSVDANAGIVSLAGGFPNGTVAFNAEVVSVLFRARHAGTTTIAIDEKNTGVYLNDGEGTLAALATKTATITIGAPDQFKPKISSPSHPDETAWYRERTLLINWVRNPQASYSFLLTQDPAIDPDDTADASAGEEQYPALTDGIWYFAVKERLADDAWGPTGRFRVMIDGTPPQAFSLTLVHEDATGKDLLTFSTLDAGSGIDHYLGRIVQPKYAWFPFFAQGEWRRVTNPIVLDTGVLLGEATVVALDGAGNSRSATLTSPRLLQAQRRFEGSVAVVCVLLLVFFGHRHFRRRRPVPIVPL